MNSNEDINKQLAEKFSITCKRCGGSDIIFYNDVRYYDYTGKVGSAGIECKNCHSEVIIDD